MQKYTGLLHWLIYFYTYFVIMFMLNNYLTRVSLIFTILSIYTRKPKSYTIRKTLKLIHKMESDKWYNINHAVKAGNIHKRITIKY